SSREPTIPAGRYACDTCTRQIRRLRNPPRTGGGPAPRGTEPTPDPRPAPRRQQRHPQSAPPGRAGPGMDETAERQGRPSGEGERAPAPGLDVRPNPGRTGLLQELDLPVGTGPAEAGAPRPVGTGAPGEPEALGTRVGGTGGAARTDQGRRCRGNRQHVRP